MTAWPWIRLLAFAVAGYGLGSIDINKKITFAEVNNNGARLAIALAVAALPMGK